jgi:predicted RNA-binding Zn ribbon-like protein
VEALDLDPGDYRGTYKLVGGRLSLDLVNTISWPGNDRAHDWLDSADNLRRWLEAVGLRRLPAKQLDLKAAIGVRDTMTAVLRPLAHALSPPREAVERFNSQAAPAIGRRFIDPATLGWKWRAPATTLDVFAPVFLDASELITTGDRERLRHCPACDWLFEDQSRNGQRRWCDMADCGSRDKSRRYYQRIQ